MKARFVISRTGYIIFVVANAMVHVDSQHVFPAGQPFQHTFTCSAPQTGPHSPRNVVTEPSDFRNPTFTVTAPGYVNGSVEFIVSGAQAGRLICH